MVTGDPLNIENRLSEDVVEIIYRPYDKYTEIGEVIVAKWTKYLQIRGFIHGCLGFSDELEMIIAEELRRRDNAISKENNSSEETDSSDT